MPNNDLTEWCATCDGCLTNVIVRPHPSAEVDTTESAFDAMWDQGQPVNVAAGQTVMLTAPTPAGDDREALYVADWRHARWVEPHSAMPGAVRVRGEGQHGVDPISTTCQTCGEVLVPSRFAARPSAPTVTTERVQRMMGALGWDRQGILYADVEMFLDNLGIEVTP